jgi:hypothetical protein
MPSPIVHALIFLKLLVSGHHPQQGGGVGAALAKLEARRSS